MKILKHVILIPVYNDWKSLNKLLGEIDKCLKTIKNFNTEILILNDKSTEEYYINKHNFFSIKKITILTLKKNLGSQKSIAIGLSYLNKSKDKFFVTVMDGDGEDNPNEIEKMLNEIELIEKYYISYFSRKL